MMNVEGSVCQNRYESRNNDCNTADTCLDPSFTSRRALLCG